MPLFYRSFERTTPILFEKLVTKSVDDAFMREKRELFDKATTSCLPSVIRMGRDLREEDLQQHVSFFREKLVGLPSRLPSIYSCYRYFAKEVREGRLVDQRHFVLIDFSPKTIICLKIVATLPRFWLSLPDFFSTEKAWKKC